MKKMVNDEHDTLRSSTELTPDQGYEAIQHDEGNKSDAFLKAPNRLSSCL